MWWAIFRCVKIILVSGVISLCMGVAANAWSVDKEPEFISTEQKLSDSYSCKGFNTYISVVGEASINACITGKTTQIASFYQPNGGIGRAIKFPYENTFYRLDVCNNTPVCEYSDITDTLISSEGMYSHFSKHLKKTISQNVIRYVPDENSEFLSVTELFERTYIIQTVALSDNGMWAMVELRGYGFVRINTLTKQTLRFIAPGFSYGYGSDPGVDMAISNDGTLASMMGSRMSVSLIKIDTYCGDTLTQYSSPYFVGATTPCRYIPTPTSSYMNNYVYAIRPKFSANSDTLSFDIYSASSPAKHITLFSNEAPSREIKYLAIGDSFSSGEGETDDSQYIGGSQNKCHVSSRSYPYLLGTKWLVRNGNTRNVACSGATIHTARIKEVSDGLSQIAILEKAMPNVVTVGMGGNDAGLMGKLKDCLGVDTCKWAATPDDRQSTVNELKSLYPQLKEFYLEVQSKTFGPVLVVGYPQIITTNATCLSAEGILLNQTERIFMNESIRYLNQVAESAARDAGIDFVDIENSLSGGNLCTAVNATFMNGIRFGDDFPNIPSIPLIKFIGTETFHPKPTGQIKIADAIANKYSSTTDIRSSVVTLTNSSLSEPSGYWNGATRQRVQRSVSFLDKLKVGISDTITIRFPALTFKAKAEVVLELHSDVKNLGTVYAADDGSLDVVVSTIGFSEGYHSLHAISTSTTDTLVDYYEFLDVEDGNNSANLTVNVANDTTNMSALLDTQNKPIGKLSAFNSVVNTAKRNVVSNPGLLFNQEIVANKEVSLSKDTKQPSSAQTGNGAIKTSSRKEKSKMIVGIAIAAFILFLILISYSVYKIHLKLVSRNNGG